jgi:ubiquinone/menaquinone biosynthesis C-methylase UbiE
MSKMTGSIVKEIKRLIIQAQSWQADAEVLLDMVGMQPGWKCVDLGCGPLGMLDSLSRRTGRHGLVVALDFNREFLRSAIGQFVSRKAVNYAFLNADVFHAALAPHSFDLTHARFIFTQVGCDDQLLEVMQRLTRPGGVVISQESDWSTWTCYPPDQGWEKMRNALISLFQQGGGDINAGSRTYRMFRSAGLMDVHIRTSIQAMPAGHPYRDGLTQMAVSFREKMIKCGIINSKEFEEALRACEKVVNDPNCIIFSYMLSQVWGTVR